MKILTNIEKAAWYLRYFGTKRLIFSAGMPRSGSTLLFNVLKLVLEKKYADDVSSGWIEEVADLSKGEIYLLKTHHLNRMGIWRALHSFYSYRDIRNVLVSRLRKFDKEPDIGMVRYYIKQYQVAKENGVVMFQYEQFHKSPEILIKKVSKMLNIKVEVDKIRLKLPDPRKIKTKTGHEAETLLHEGHVTGTKKNEWKDVLPVKLQKQIHEEFGWWLKENGYEI